MVVVGLIMVQSGAGSGMMFMLMVPMMLATSLASVVLYFRQKNQNEALKEKRERRYRQLLADYEQQLQTLRDDQLKTAYFNDPAPEECLNRVKKLDKALWSRTIEDDDYLSVRIGLGDRHSSVTVKVPRISNPIEPDPLVLEARRLKTRYETISHMPIHLPIKKMGVTGIVGPEELRLNTARAVLLQLATHHAPNEVQIMVLFEQSAAKDWLWVRWLPHVWDEEKSHRFLANDQTTSRNLFLYLDELIDKRKQRLVESTSSDKPTFRPDIVIMLAAPSLTENEPIVHRILNEGPDLGIFPIFLRESAEQLPQTCRAYVRLSADGGIEKGRVLFLGESSKDRFVPDKVPAYLANQYALAIAPIRLKESQKMGIPKSVSLLELFGVNRVEDLDLSGRWAISQKSGRSLAVPIGVQAGGKLRTLDLHEKKDGPNGLVAGMVGSGKSVLLETLVASLAVNYHPHRVAFILIDYKGGGMATPFKDLPHTLGIITNLQKGNLATRALTSLRVEAERRQRVFEKLGVNHIDDYQKKYYNNEVDDPMPYLVIIVDEFAEMKSEEPDIAKEFVKIARLGRALGFRLILAMQKPAGVVDGQIEANTRFRLCLRVAQTEDSQAMLKRPDAAYLAGNGRAYLQVGANEVFELFQVAWGGAIYDPEGLLQPDPNEISLVHLDGTRDILYQPERSPIQDEISQLSALTNYIVEFSHQNKIKQLPGLWLPPLPERLLLDVIRPKGEGWNGKIWLAADQWLAPVVGLLDNPSKQEQTALRIDFGSTRGHLAVYGEPSSGKTTFIQTLVTSLALTYSPEDINIYMMDFGGRLLKMFEELPHVGGVVIADEEERFNRLLNFILREIETRKKLFGESHVSTLRAYREATNKKLPALILIIDNFANLLEAHDDAEETIIKIARDGGNLGVYLVLTASSVSDIRFRVSSNITQAIALSLVEKSDYNAIVGRTDITPAPVRGRGLIRMEPNPLEFQTAIPGGGDSDLQRSASLKELMLSMSDAWQGSRAKPIPVLPDSIALSEIVTNTHLENIPDSYAPLGLYVEDLSIFALSLEDGPNFLVSGPVQSGKTTLLKTWMLTFANLLSPEQLRIYIFDSRKSGLRQMTGLPHVREAQDYANDPEDSHHLLTALNQILDERERQLLSRRTTGKPVDMAESNLDWQRILIIIDDALDPINDPIYRRNDDATYGDSLQEQNKKLLNRIIRKGRDLGVYVIVSSQMSDIETGIWERPSIKLVKNAETGFMLASSSDVVFNLRLPREEREAKLLSGEGFWCHHGIVSRIKIALPGTPGATIEDWLISISERWQHLSHSRKDKAIS